MSMRNIDRAMELQNIKEQIEDLMEEAREVLRGTVEKPAAEAYWIAHIEGALEGDTGSMVTMDDTIQALEESGDGEG